MKLLIPSYSFDTETSYLAKYFPWGEPDQSYDFSEPHSHTYHEILIFRKGGSFHLMGSEMFEIKDYSIHILPANYAHNVNRGKESQGFALGCSDHFLDKLEQFNPSVSYSSFCEKPVVLNVSETQFNSFTYYFEELIEHENNTSYFLNVMSLVFLKMIQYKDIEKTIDTSDSMAYQISKTLNKHYKQKPNTEFYARELGVSKSTLAKKCQTLFGCSIMDFQNRKLISELKQNLLYSECSISELAFEYNFSSPTHLSKFFKTHNGISPSDFKNAQIVSDN